ncbi:MAG TPA: hypothetical protein VFA50_00380 [Stellaceae bacterium]|nr:hypothetical protein [Stellaceae bacterium]
MRSLGLALAILILALAATPGRSAATQAWDGAFWGETSRALLDHFGARATRLRQPIDFGDSYADVALRGERLGGYAFTLYFQMDKSGGGLKRMQLERGRHGANPRVFAAAVRALAAEYGPPAKRCRIDARRENGYQAASEALWLRDGNAIRATFRDTTLEASEGCALAAPAARGACGLTGRLFIRISPDSAQAESCG